MEHGELWAEAAEAKQGLQHEAGEAEGREVPGFDWVVVGAQELFDPLGKEEEQCAWESSRPLGFSEDAGVVEGHHLPLIALAAWRAGDWERWHICLRLQWAEVHETSVVVVMVRAVVERRGQAPALLELHCESSATEAEVEVHLGDFQHYCQYSGG